MVTLIVEVGYRMKVKGKRRSFQKTLPAVQDIRWTGTHNSIRLAGLNEMGRKYVDIMGSR